MRNPSSERVLNALYEQIDRLGAGARLPTVRELMRTFRVSQAAVQEAFGRLRNEGLVSSQVGRGTYVLKTAAQRGGDTGGAGAGASAPDSLLILSNASMNERGVLVQNRIMAEMAQGGGRVVQMSYHDTEHLLHILGSIPEFGAAILQPHFESIPVRLLSLLQQKARAVVVDGHSLAGMDLDRVGTDWEEALELALRHLTRLGHRRIGLVSLDTEAQPVLSVRRSFPRLARLHGCIEAGGILLEGVLHPSQSVGQALRAALAAAMEEGRLPFTALIFIGMTDALGIRHCLDELGIGCPEDLSVYFLGHHDVPTEHFGFFTMAGSAHLEAAEKLFACLRNRLAAPGRPPQVVYLPCREAVRASTRRPAA